MDDLAKLVENEERKWTELCKMATWNKHKKKDSDMQENATNML